MSTKRGRLITAGALVLLQLVMCSTVAAANPSFTVGSNRYMTAFAYPHDILEWPERAVVLHYNPQTLPWHGDVDDIANRPSESYTSTYQSVEFAPPSGYLGDPTDVRSWMEVSSYASRNRYIVGGVTTTEYGKVLLELGMTSIGMELTAEGVGRAYEGDGEQRAYYMVPFEGETNSGKRDLDLTLTYANRVLDHPVGLRVRHIKKTSEVPSGYVTYTKEGETYSTPHLTWGWATSGCNHIFGYSHINTDAFFQSGYTVFDGSQWDVQASFEHDGNYKSGIRYRTSVEDGENYSWRYDDGSDHDGDYYVDDTWKDRKASSLLRGYSKVRFWEVGDADLGVLFFLQRHSASRTEVNKLVESDPETEEAEGGFIIETNPFINYEFGRGYFDCGLLLELSGTGMENTRTRWNSVSGSEQPGVLWSTDPYLGWSTTWENSSRGSDWFFATGFEASSSVNVYKRLAVQSSLLVLRKYSRIEKHYGDSEIPDGGSSFEFEQTHRRVGNKTETWMTGSVGLSYGWGPIQAIVSMQLPIAYQINQRTMLEDDDEVLFEHSKSTVWQVQEPVNTRVMIVYLLGGHGHPAG